MDPYYIFPMELWQMIFNKMEEPLAKLNLLRAHPHLQKQFEEKEEQLLLLLIAKHRNELELKPDGVDNLTKKKLRSLQLMLEYSKNLETITLDLKQWFNRAISTEPFAFPELPYLEDLTLSWGHLHFPVDTFTSISKYFPQLVKLEFEDFVDFPKDFLGNSGLFPNLKSLKLSTKTGTIRHSEAEVKLRRIFRQIAAPNLTEIEVAFQNPYPNQYLPTGEGELDQVETVVLFCLNINKSFCSHPEHCWWTSLEVEQRGLVKLTFSRTLPKNYGLINKSLGVCNCFKSEVMLQMKNVCNVDNMSH